MSTSFDEILGASSPGTSYYVPQSPLTQRSESMGHWEGPFDTMGFEASGLKMEETLDFSSQALSSLGDVLGHDFAEAHFQIPLPPAPVGLVPSVKAEKVISPMTFLDEEEEEEEGDSPNPKWELELEHLISEIDEGKMASLLDKKVEEELLHAPVKDFNKRTRAMKLSEEIKNVLKLKRKRVRNKQAATRSRARKETLVVDLQGQVDQLIRVRDEQQITIRNLQHRTAFLERELAKAKAKLEG